MLAEFRSFSLDSAARLGLSALVHSPVFRSCLKSCVEVWRRCGGPVGCPQLVLWPTICSLNLPGFST